MTDTENNTKIILEVGDVAPIFKAEIQNADGTITDFDLEKVLKTGKKVLLVFYPGDDTPGCTKQLCGLRDIYKEYQDLGVEVVGVNPANAESHLKFIKKYSYPFGIIVDSDKSIRAKYGATKAFFKHLVTKRGVFLIDTDGKILFIHWGQQDNQKILNLLTNK